MLLKAFLFSSYFFFFCLDSYLQAQALQEKGWVDPECQGKDGSYFPLRDGPIDSAVRASWYNDDCLAKDMVIFRIDFTPVGVSTLFPGVLWVQPGGDETRYRYSDRLYRNLSSSDDKPVLLCELSHEQLQIV